MTHPLLRGLPKTPAPADALLRRLVLARLQVDGIVRLGEGVAVACVDSMAAIPTGLAAGTLLLGLDGSMGQVDANGDVQTAPTTAAALTWELLQTFTLGILIEDSGALKFGTPGTDVVFTSDGTDVDVTGTGKLDMRDDVAHFVDPSSPTKRMRLDAGAVTAGQTRVLSMPDANVDLGAVSAASLASGATFTSTEQTGTGSSQNIAHGLGSTPRIVWWTVSDAAAGLIAGPPPVLSMTPGAHDATNIKMTVTSGVKYYVFAIK